MGSCGAELVSSVLREVCSCRQFIRRWPLEVELVGTESLRVHGSGGATLGLWLQGRSFGGGACSGRGHPGKPPDPAPGKLFLSRGGGQVRSRGGRGGPGGPRPCAGVRRQLRSSVWLRGTAESNGAMPTNFTVVPVEARADGAGDEAAERTEEPESPESADPASPTPGELGRTCNRTKAEAGPFCCRWAALARWLAAARAARSGAMGRGQKGQLVPAWLGGVTRDRERILGLVVCWLCSFSLLNSVLCSSLGLHGTPTACLPVGLTQSALGARFPPLFMA